MAVGGVRDREYLEVQERLRPAAWDTALALAWLGALAKNAKPSPVFSAPGIEDVDIHLVMGDAADKATVEQMQTQAQETFGGVDIYVSCAARRLYKDFFETTDEDWHYHLNQQLTASWYLAKAFVPGMRDRGWGRVVHINGEDGWLGGWTRIPHSVGKGGLRTLTKSLASGLGQYGITVNDVSPGFIDTIRDTETHPEVTRGRTQEFLPAIPIRRQPTPQEMAWACAFLCSTRSAAITGAAIHVNGGQWMFG